MRLLLPRVSQRTLAALAASAVLLLPLAACADVIGEGDVTPTAPTLPIDGGPVAGDIVVGGTSATPTFPNFGRLIIDTPAFTDPLEVTGNAYIGFNPIGIGEVTVTGFAGLDTPQSELRISGFLSVGTQGVGYLNVTGGGLVQSGFAGSASGDDPDAIVGDLTGSQGFVTVTGIGSQFVNTNLVVGFEGIGRVEANTRGIIHTLDEAILGDEANIGQNDLGMGYVLLDGLGTRWNVGFGDTQAGSSTGTLTVGREGRGTVEIRNQALAVVRDDVLIGDVNGSFGQVFVSGLPAGINEPLPAGRAMLWTYENLFVGGTGSAVGELHIDNFGIARADGNTNVRSRGLVELNGGTLLTPSVTNAGVIRGDGRIEAATIENNGQIRNAAATANHRERLWVTGTVDNNGDIESVGGEMEFESLVTNNGPDGDIYGKDAIFRFNGGLDNTGNVFLDNTTIWTPGTFQTQAALVLAPSTSTLIGDLDMAGSNAFFIELGDPEFSRLEIAGDAAVDGLISIGLTNDYDPEIGDSFEIVFADDGVAGTFSSVAAPFINGFSFTVDYLPNAVVINVEAGGVFNADFDMNGQIDGNDFLIWQKFLGVGTTFGQGDADADGDVDAQDLAVWRFQAGQGPSVPSFSPVPEPGTLALVLVAGVLLARPVALLRSRQS
jgi:T5SS/PEP-CTERM-associated repeat protein